MIHYKPEVFEKYEQTLKNFLDSPQYKEVIISHLCHTRRWLYEWGQVLRVKMLPNGKWKAPSEQCWSTRGSYVQVLTQSDYHWREMEKIGIEEDFEVILKRSPEEARAVAERLYALQEEYIKRNTLESFAISKARGYDY